ncbi:hypothetical protein SK128_011539 [Halocaridina rubra]|uniref:Endonuclease/exonuclease/phosphatase domain-containing protein n=1 Tax=Halocaridina rubra TaxID=373956 RepID=A0AAN9A0H5_HALRR
MCGILPRLSQSSEWWSRAIGVNARMKVFCRENNIGFIDGWDHFTSRKHMYARDGVHLSNSGVSVLAGVVYRPPDLDNIESQVIYDEISKVTRSNRVCIVGDFNFRHINWETITGDSSSKGHRRELEKKNLLLEEAQTQTSSPGGSSIRSGFKKVSNLLQVVPMPMGLPRRRSVTVLQVDGGGSSSRRASRSSINETSTSPRGSLFFFPISRRASRASATSATSGASNPSLVSVQIHHVADRDSPHASQGSTEAVNTEVS